jgi:hypothetical protein
VAWIGAVRDLSKPCRITIAILRLPPPLDQVRNRDGFNHKEAYLAWRKQGPLGKKAEPSRRARVAEEVRSRGEMLRDVLNVLTKSGFIWPLSV